MGKFDEAVLSGWGPHTQQNFSLRNEIFENCLMTAKQIFLNTWTNLWWRKRTFRRSFRQFPNIQRLMKKPKQEQQQIGKDKLWGLLTTDMTNSYSEYKRKNSNADLKATCKKTNGQLVKSFILRTTNERWGGANTKARRGATGCIDPTQLHIDP